MLRFENFDYVQEHRKEVEEWIRQMHGRRDKRMRENEQKRLRKEERMKRQMESFEDHVKKLVEDSNKKENEKKEREKAKQENEAKAKESERKSDDQKEKERESDNKSDDKEKNSVKNSEKNSAEIIEKKESYLATKSEEKRVFISRHPQCIFYCKNFHLVANTSNDLFLPSDVVTLLQKFGNLIQKEVPHGLETCMDSKMLNQSPTLALPPIEIYFELKSEAPNVIARNTLDGPPISNFGDEDCFNSRSNSLKEGGDDMSQGGASQLVIKNDMSPIRSMDQGALKGLGGSKTRASAKKAQEVLNQILSTLTDTSPNGGLDGVEDKMVTYLIQLEDP